MNTLLIAGTEAQVGKTVVLSALIAYWQRYCKSRRLGVMKPIDCPAANREPDHMLLKQLFQLDQTPAEITPLLLQADSLLALTSERSNHHDLEHLWRSFQQLQQQRDFVVLETWKGLGAPLNPQTIMADLAWDWQIPTVLVVPVQPEAVSQIVAHVALARQARVHLKGIVLNAVQPCRPEDWQNWVPIDLIQSLTQKPVLGCVPHLEDPQAIDPLVQIASNWELEALFPELSELVVSG